MKKILIVSIAVVVAIALILFVSLSNATTDGSFTQINIKEPETITFTINDITITCNRTDVQVFLEVFR